MAVSKKGCTNLPEPERAISGLSVSVSCLPCSLDWHLYLVVTLTAAVSNHRYLRCDLDVHEQFEHSGGSVLRTGPTQGSNEPLPLPLSYAPKSGYFTKGIHKNSYRTCISFASPSHACLGADFIIEFNKNPVMLCGGLA